MRYAPNKDVNPLYRVRLILIDHRPNHILFQNNFVSLPSHMLDLCNEESKRINSFFRRNKMQTFVSFDGWKHTSWFCGKVGTTKNICGFINKFSSYYVELQKILNFDKDDNSTNVIFGPMILII